VRRGISLEALKQELMMQSQPQDVYVCPCNRHHGTTYSHIEYNEISDSSLHDSNSARYFERLGGNQCGREINAQAGEVLR
jgi:hypothetical protein